MYKHRCAKWLLWEMSVRSPTDVAEGLKSAGRTAHFTVQSVQLFWYSNVGERNLLGGHLKHMGLRFRALLKFKDFSLITRINLLQLRCFV